MRIILLGLLIGLCCIVTAQNYNTQVQQNSVVINNQPVIERVQYIERYRTVYVEKPQPKRRARRLTAPVCLVGEIWVYTEDLGDFKCHSDAQEILNRLNRGGTFGRSNWRIPTPAELALMENYAEDCGLGDGIYLATDHRNGILRPVSTGPSVSEQQEAIRLARLEQERQEAAHTEQLSRQNKLLYSGAAVDDGEGLLWAPKNEGASSSTDKGRVMTYYDEQNGWRLPTEAEMKRIESRATLLRRPVNGHLQTFFQLGEIMLPGGRYLTRDGYYDLGNNDGLSGMQGYVRAVRQKIN